MRQELKLIAPRQSPRSTWCLFVRLLLSRLDETRSVCVLEPPVETIDAQDGYRYICGDCPIFFSGLRLVCAPRVSRSVVWFFATGSRWKFPEYECRTVTFELHEYSRNLCRPGADKVRGRRRTSTRCPQKSGIIYCYEFVNGTLRGTDRSISVARTFFSRV